MSNNPELQPKNGSIRGPVEIPFFSEHPNEWKQVSFGPVFGCAVDINGHGYIWSQDKKNIPIEILQPKIKNNRNSNYDDLDLEPKNANSFIIDMQCGDSVIYALTKTGDVYRYD